MIRSRRLLLLAPLLAALVLVAACEGGEGGGAAGAPPSAPGEPANGATPTETPTAAPDPTPMPGDAGPNRDFELRPATDGVEFFRGGGEDLAEGPGTYFLDIETGVIEGWRGIEVSGLSDHNRIAAGAGVLADRRTETVYRWDGDAEVVASSGGAGVAPGALATADGLVVFRVPEQGGDDEFAVIDLDAGPALVGTFRAPVPRHELPHETFAWSWGLLSPDGTQAVVVTSAIYLADIATGEVEELGPRPFADATPNGRAGLHGISLRNTLDGEAFLLAVETGTGAAWVHYTWEGELFAEGSGGGHVSRDGRFLARVERAAIGDTSPEQPGFAVIDVIDLTDGAPLFRVTGGSICSIDMGNPWLADSSGIVVRDARGSYVATRDGEVRLLPAPAGPSPGSEPTRRLFLGEPSPESTSVFAVGGSVAGGPLAFDAGGDVLAQATVAAGTRSFVPPWGGQNGREVRFLTPHGGHGPYCGSMSPLETDHDIVRPRVEHPPYDDALVIELHEDAEGAALVAGPGSPDVTGRLSAPLTVTVHQLEVVAGDEAPHFHHLWGRVTTASAEDGWLLLGLIFRGP